MMGILPALIMHRFRHPARWLIPLLFGGLLATDSLAYLKAWGEQRHQFSSAQAVTLPSPPEIYSQRYLWLTDRGLRDLSAYGIIEVVEMVEQHEGGVALPLLRDGRQWHLAAAGSNEKTVPSSTSANKLADTHALSSTTTRRRT